MPDFNLRVELHLSRLSSHVTVEDSALIPDKVLDQAWNMMNAFVWDMLDDLDPDTTDERFREIFIEVCYRLIYREMFTMTVFPDWEESDLNRLGTNKRGPRVDKKGSYGYSEW